MKVTMISRYWPFDTPPGRHTVRLCPNACTAATPATNPATHDRHIVRSVASRFVHTV